MKYNQLESATFLSRPNRFVAMIGIGGQEIKCHVKNTGRLGELLISGAQVLVEPASTPGRKTPYDLLCVKKDGRWVNIDSQAPNELAEEWIREGGFLPEARLIRREMKKGKSRFDLYVETDQEKWYIEVKGVTLNQNGVAMFPDAPTLRGLKHVRELADLVREGYRAAILFVITMKGVDTFAPHKERQPEFARALAEARDQGVEVLAVDCIGDDTSIHIDQWIPVDLS